MKISESGNSQDIELNLASIIDCFTVLIAFMLASASFLSIGIIDAGIAAAGVAPASQSPPAVQLSVELKPDRSIQLVLSGKSTRKQSVAAKSQAWDYEALTQQLQSFKSQWSDLTGATLVAENTIEYRDVIKAMDVTRKTFPAVLLGGF